jgi:hypothetical protein|tara:strand:- start:762 stop:1355 length:594 start_codon:yes stop_codon:yes gene_type:complete
MNKNSIIMIFTLFMILNGCATPETPNKFGLLENSAINMNGYWEYIGDYNENEKQIISAIKDSSGVVYRAIKTTGVFDGKSNEKVRKNSRGVAHLFFENSKKIQITQTNYSIFINFDRSIVEEYSFGELKKIQLGNVSAMRSSGWVDKSYFIETLDAYGMKITEKYSLTANNNLERIIIFRDNKMNDVKIEQLYRKTK